jgi:ferredoxin-NADP reductase
VWEARLGGPLVLIGGGSGIVPLMSMLRHHSTAHSKVPVRLLYSSRTYVDIIYRDELTRLASDGSGLEVFHTLTRAQPTGWSGYARRIDADMLRDVLKPYGKNARIYICGPTPLVEAAADGVVKLGVPANQVRTERFGPTGN